MPHHDPTQELKIKKIFPHATLPTRAHPGDAGLDLYSLESFELAPQQSHVTQTGIAIALPHGYVGLVADRSSMAKRGVKTVGGVIDAGYRGQVHIVLFNISSTPVSIQAGDRIAQLMILPMIAPMPLEVQELDETSRGDKGFGSSGR